MLDMCDDAAEAAAAPDGGAAAAPSVAAATPQPAAPAASRGARRESEGSAALEGAKEVAAPEAKGACSEGPRGRQQRHHRALVAATPKIFIVQERPWQGPPIGDRRQIVGEVALQMRGRPLRAARLFPFQFNSNIVRGSAENGLVYHKIYDSNKNWRFENGYLKQTKRPMRRALCCLVYSSHAHP